MALDRMTVDNDSSATRAQHSAPRATGGPCSHCRHGLHHLCVGVACFRCPSEHHRRHGVAGGSRDMWAGEKP